MSDKQYKTVVEGEASESEEEELENDPGSVVVEGEAEETDEEEEHDTNRGKQTKGITPLKLSEQYTSFESLDDVVGTSSFSFRKVSGKAKHDTVLNKKLWDSNLSLCSSIVGAASQAYLQSAKEITNCSHQVSRSHTLLQDVSHNMRLMTNDLFNLHDRIDIITSCTILPTINIQKRPPEANHEGAQPSTAETTAVK